MVQPKIRQAHIGLQMNRESLTMTRKEQGLEQKLFLYLMFDKCIQSQLWNVTYQGKDNEQELLTAVHDITVHKIEKHRNTRNYFTLLPET